MSNTADSNLSLSLKKGELYRDLTVLRSTPLCYETTLQMALSYIAISLLKCIVATTFSELFLLSMLSKMSYEFE